MCKEEGGLNMKFIVERENFENDNPSQNLVRFEKKILKFESFVEKSRNEGGLTPTDVISDDDVDKDFDEEE